MYKRERSPVISWLCILVVSNLSISGISEITESTILGVGSSMAELLMSRAMSTFSFMEDQETHFAYKQKNSETGMCRVKDYYTYCDWDQDTVPYADFAVSETKLTEEDMTRWPDLLMLPLVAHAVAMPVNVKDYDSRAPNLVLERITVARIFSGKITRWNDPEIAAAQSVHVARLLPDAEIQLVVRSDLSGTTEVFKKSVSSFSDEFREQIGTTGEPTWPGINSTRIHFRAGNSGVASGVSMIENSIGYCDLATVHNMNLRMVDMNQIAGTLVTPEIASIEYAMYEKGMEVGSMHSMDETDLMGATGDHSWPISTYTYMVVRTNIKGDRLRQGATCTTVEKSVTFLEWFYSSNVLEALVHDFYAVPLAQTLRDGVLSDIATYMYCDGVHIKSQDFSHTFTGEDLIGTGNPLATTILETIFLGYQDLNAHTLLHYEPDVELEDDYLNTSVARPLEEDEPWRVIIGNQIHSQPWFTGSQYNELHELILGLDTYLAMPWYLFPITVLYNIPTRYGTSEPLVLNQNNIIDILNGRVATWDDIGLNENNIWLADGYFDANIVVFSVESEVDLLYQILFDLLGMEDGIHPTGWKRIKKFATYEQVISAVEQTPGSLAIVP